MTLGMTVALLSLGTVFVTASEWSNPNTLGGMDGPGRVLAGFFQAVMPRTAGFNSLDYGQMHGGTLFGTEILMFIGGGSAGTAGGIKVTTFLLLFYVIYAEVRGEQDVEVFQRRIGERAVRQALTVALLSVGAIAAATLILLELTPYSTEQVLFEAVSAFSTVGLSTGITADLDTGAQMVLTVLMFVGRLGPITMVSALALRERGHAHRLPEGRPIIG
jgi:Trk-type K+ transport system membrane component